MGNPSISGSKVFRSYRPRPTPKDNPQGAVYSHAFLEDVQYHVIPYGGRSATRPSFTIQLEPEYRAGNEILSIAFSREVHARHRFADVICQFIGDSAARIANKGIACYEILRGDIFMRDDVLRRRIQTAVAPEKLFRLNYIFEGIQRIGGQYLQFISHEDWATARRVISVIPASQIWPVRLPPTLGTARQQRQMLKALVQGSSASPDFVVKTMEEMKTDFKGFDSIEFNRGLSLLMANETALWGWPGRSSWQRHTLGYFAINRQLRFAYNMAILREHLLAAINGLLDKLLFPSHLVIKGLPTAGEIQETLIKLERGGISFEDALEAIRI